jgi:hypothetical protein
MAAASSPDHVQCCTYLVFCAIRTVLYVSCLQECRLCFVMVFSGIRLMVDHDQDVVKQTLPWVGLAIITHQVHPPLICTVWDMSGLL